MMRRLNHLPACIVAWLKRHKKFLLKLIVGVLLLLYC